MKIINTDYFNDYILVEFKSKSDHYLSLVVKLEKLAYSEFTHDIITEYYAEYNEIDPVENNELISYLMDCFTYDEQDAITHMRNALESVLESEVD